ncbi:hypothetical protein [Klebsiella oxytoca]|uniref:hypothetical protein n=1 Tax=Klebsiella oxytoca TaxID=571 RepID=UPI001D0ED02F|nr:hypothetical protein [Klebsiella oxytoca]
MTSKLTREELLNIIETDHVQCGEAAYLARIALAAIDSEPVELPLDYLQGHKDGLEWAAQLAKANHPETGDWLYDDPIELAKAISKGPDMPPSQPALDGEPVAWKWRLVDLATGDPGEWRVTLAPSLPGKGAGYRTETIPLYRHAQQPVVPDGYVLVPKEPTRQMMSQGHFAMKGTDRGKFRRIYQAMIAAAQQEMK